MSPVKRVAPQVSTRLKRPGVVAPTQGVRVMSDVATPRTGTSATSLHRGMKAARGGVLDLRPQTISTPEPSPSVTPKPAAVPVAKPAPEQPAAVVTSQPSEARRPEPAPFASRHERARQTERSQHISKFHFDQFADKQTPPAEPMAAQLPQAAITHHEALGRLINQMPPVNLPSATSRTARVGAVLAAIAIMAGYIWLQNYPKMAIQAAGNKAGLAASLPGYVPSSYSLKQTDAVPGLVTLNFKSPNQSQPLTISQKRTDWDSRSLLDNVVAKHTSDYAAINGQGLTVYMFGDNQAAWINHGVWYSITGATRLSREQILKIVYSL